MSVNPLSIKCPIHSGPWVACYVHAMGTVFVCLERLRAAGHRVDHRDAALCAADGCDHAPATPKKGETP